MKRPFLGREPGKINIALEDLLATCKGEHQRMVTLWALLFRAAELLAETSGRNYVIGALRSALKYFESQPDDGRPDPSQQERS